MRLFLITLILLSMAGGAVAGLVGISDGKGAKVFIQGFAPNGKLGADLTNASTTRDHRNVTSWQLYTPNDCKFRVMSTATKRGKLRTWLGGMRDGKVVNPATPFTNFSGCTSGELDEM